MYCKSAIICKSGQFELDSVINWRPILLLIQSKSQTGYLENGNPSGILN